MEVLYILIWLVVLAISTYLFYHASGTLSLAKPNIHSFAYYYSFLVSSLIGTLLIVLNIDHSYIIVKLIHQETREIGFYLICLAVVLLPLAMVIVSKLLGFDAKKEFQQYWDAPIVGGFGNERLKKEFYWLFTVLSLICLFSILYVFMKSETIPLLDKILGAEKSLGELRQDAKSGYNGNVFVKNIFAIGLTPLLSLVAYAFSVKTKEARWKIHFLLLFVGSIAINIYDFQKAPVLFYLAMFVLLRMYLGKIRLNMKMIIAVAILGVAYLGVSYASAGVKDSNAYLSYSSGPIGRIILTQIAPTFMFIDRYGETYPFLEERGLPPALLNIYEIDEVRSARVLMEDLFPEKVEEGTAGVLNTLFVGEAYAAFGYWGVIFGACYLGFMIQLLYIHFLRLPKHPVFISLFVYFIVNIPRALVGGFSDLLFNPIWLVMYGVLASTYLYLKLRQSFPGHFAQIKERN